MGTIQPHISEILGLKFNGAEIPGKKFLYFHYKVVYFSRNCG